MSEHLQHQSCPTLLPLYRLLPHKAGDRNISAPGPSHRRRPGPLCVLGPWVLRCLFSPPYQDPACESTSVLTEQSIVGLVVLLLHVLRSSAGPAALEVKSTHTLVTYSDDDGFCSLDRRRPTSVLVLATQM